MNISKHINELIANRPKYEISPTVLEDQALANANAFGQDRVLEGERAQLGEETASGISQAEKYSGSANSILATLSSLTGSQQKESRNLGIAGAQLRNQKIGQKYGIDQNAEAAYDKAFNWNVAGKYADMLNQLYQRKISRDAHQNQLIGAYSGSAGAGYGQGKGGKTSITSAYGTQGNPYAGGPDNPDGESAPDAGASGGGGGGGKFNIKSLFA